MIESLLRLWRQLKETLAYRRKLRRLRRDDPFLYP